MVPARGWATTRRPWRETKSSGDAPKKVPSGTGMEKTVQLGSWERRRRSTVDRGSGPVKGGREWAGQHHLLERGSVRVHVRHGPSHQVGVAVGIEVRAEAGHGHLVGSVVRTGPVLPDHGVEELVGVGQRRVAGPYRGGPTVHGAVGIGADAHGEAGHDQGTVEGVDEGQGAERHHARSGPLHQVVAVDGGQDPGGSRRRHQLCRAPADQGQSGAVEQHRRAAVELQGVGPVVERDGAGVQALVHGVPARVAMTSWLRPPARGRMPTVA